MTGYDDGLMPAKDAAHLTAITHYAGAFLSLALVLGIGFWGYKLIIRDVSGIPVVRAMEGDMRVLPENPGGGVAAHVGLSVNEVAAVGVAGGPEDRLVLAPRDTGLTAEDLRVQPTLASVTVPAPVVSAPTPIMPSQSSISLPPPVTADPPAAMVQQVAAEVIPADVPGLAVSMRPVPRPQKVAFVQPAVPAADPGLVTQTAFAPGTDLVQLGAYKTPTMAATAWTALQERFGAVMADKDRVIQMSNQSSGTWYRLRASGFIDRADARRFCAVFTADSADCIALVVE